MTDINSTRGISFGTVSMEPELGVVYSLYSTSKFHYIPKISWRKRNVTICSCHLSKGGQLPWKVLYYVVDSHFVNHETCLPVFIPLCGTFPNWFWSRAVIALNIRIKYTEVFADYEFYYLQISITWLRTKTCVFGEGAIDQQMSKMLILLKINKKFLSCFATYL